MRIQIGSPHWVQDLKQITVPLGADFWDDFVPADESELKQLEKQIGRRLPDEFRELYRSVGYGQFSWGGGFYSPADIVACLGAPVYFVLGSCFSGQEWATEEEHRRLWITRGNFNPAPRRFTDDNLTFEDVKLYDLLQFGSNGSCCYHQLYLGPEPAPFRYCLLTPDPTMEDKTPTLSLALEKIVDGYLVFLEDD